tara:strand:- start:5 stop:130 length:126 start_codon:yes stop_codon:yes gene_type:complete
MELAEHSVEAMEELVPRLFSTLKADFINIRHTLEEDKLTIE